MPAVSKAQQRFMGMVHAAQKGDMENPSPEVEKAADSMSDKDAKDFASTSHKGLPDKIKEMVLAELRSVRAIQTDYAKVLDSMEKHLEAYKQSKGTPAEKQHIQQLKTLTAQKKKLAAELDAKVSGMYKVAELKVDEATTTGDVAGYGTPYAFGRKEDEESKGKKQAALTGYSVVKEGLYYVGYNKGRGQGKGVFKDSYSSYKDAKKAVEKIEKERGGSYNMIAYYVSDKDGNFVMNENRWVALKKEDAPATTKVNKGISNINKQLAEIEKFLGWYGKLKSENGVSNESFWKRTNSNIYKIKERLIRLEQQIRKISE
jgi:hypothetical protein